MKNNLYRALLVDLDGTLLDIDMEEFIPAYIRQAAHKFTDYLRPEEFAGHLLGSTREMVENSDPERTNETVFFEDFCRRLQQPREVIYPLFERFYEDEFPLLRHLSKPRPLAPDVVAAARAGGLKLVLATNPLFPLTAVEHRLAWSNLSPAGFDLITTVENMHFCKPKTEYYLEIAGLIDCPPEQCLMAGNDVQEDLSAALTGMDTFLVEGMIIDRGDPALESTYRGSLKELAELVRGSPLSPFGGEV